MLTISARHAVRAARSLPLRGLATSASVSSAPRPEIILDRKGDSLVYTLNRPKALNALSLDMIVSLKNLADEWREDPNIKFVVGLGEGRAFAAGGDIKAVVDAVRAGESPRALAAMADSYRLNWKVAHLGKPYVVFMDGIVMGGGAGLSLPADIRIATRRTIFALPEQRIGFSPDVGAYFLTQLDGQIGTWLAVTGSDIYGRAAYELGLATHYVAEEAVPEIAERIAALKTPTTDELSALVAEYHIAGNDQPSSKANPDGVSVLQGPIRKFLDETFALPSLSAVYRRLKEAETETSLGEEVRTWAASQRAVMDTRGPTGMAVAVENYHLVSKAKRYATCIDHDMCIGAGFVGTNRASNDLVVGAVHSLFEKNRSPIPFNPPITDLDNPALAPDAIRARFLTRANLPEACEPELVPPPTDGAPDHLWGQFRRYGLPCEAAVREAAAGPVSEDELVRRVLAARPADSRQDEFAAAVRRIAAEHMDRQGELLTWRE